MHDPLALNDERGPQSHWLATAHRRPRPRLDEDLTVDVAVIGGGIAGLVTAWELAKAGREAVVLEADRLLSGTTGSTTGKVTALHGLRYERLRRTVGEEGAGLYAAAQQDAIERLVALAAELGTDAELELRPAYTYVTEPESVADVRAETAAARAAGLDAHFVTDTGLPFPVAAAVRVDDQYQFHPAAFLTSLADALVSAGGRIHERTRVIDLHERAHIRLETEDGAVIKASDAVVATGFPVFAPTSLLIRLAPRHELVIAAPLPEDADPQGMYLTPEDRTRSVRTAPHGSGRLLIVTGEAFRPGAGDVGVRYARLESWARRYFPGFGEAGAPLRWAAQDVDSADLAPYVGHMHPGTQHVYVATGFGGWGMSGGVMAGRLLAAHLLGLPRPSWTEVCDPRRPAPPRELPELVREQREVAAHYLGDRRRLERAESLDALLPGTGAVVRDHGQPRAVQRDVSGVLHALSARCTHMGCLVAYNEAEQTWECPCHGSRFAPDGTVLQGPATEPLPRRARPDV
ncbi:FAD-dependent oxidoreductase [Streptomyces sp. HUAS MG47]|uniref:FAD-dependent oxidoreductase n=1 Tax=Streptomyces solicamelliae TaxID=3231716 RepID=UPI0038783F5E